MHNVLHSRQGQAVTLLDFKTAVEVEGIPTFLLCTSYTSKGGLDTKE
jgi:hypothetical protein